MLKAFKFRLYPSDAQKMQIEQHFGCCRLVWNLALEAKKRAWESARIDVSRFDLQKQLVELKKEYIWLYEVHSQALTSVLLHLDTAFDKFFKGAGYPRFKNKGGRQSFQFPQFVTIEKGYIKLPKIKKVRCEKADMLEGQVKTVTISKTSTGKYYASVLVDNKRELPTKPQTHPEKTTGVDVGIKSFAITSDGKFYAPNRYLQNSLDRLRCLQRRASRKKKGSNSKKKAALKSARINEKITNQRTDHIHKITTQLVRDSQAETFVIEDLNLVGMVQNRSLSRVISDASFGEFFRQMKYKCEWYGKNLIVIDRFAPSSKRCSECGEINNELTLSDREWGCSCGAHHDRDLNAAKNIKYYGLLKHSGVGSPGEPVESRRLRRAKKQEKYFT